MVLIEIYAKKKGHMSVIKYFTSGDIGYYTDLLDQEGWKVFRRTIILKDVWENADQAVKELESIANRFYERGLDEVL